MSGPGIPKIRQLRKQNFALREESEAPKSLTARAEEQAIVPYFDSLFSIGTDLFIDFSFNSRRGTIGKRSFL